MGEARKVEGLVGEISANIFVSYPIANTTLALSWRRAAFSQLMVAGGVLIYLRRATGCNDLIVLVGRFGISAAICREQSEND
jgi:hypothetical protein